MISISGDISFPETKLQVLISVHNRIAPSTQNLKSIENWEKSATGLCS